MKTIKNYILNDFDAIVSTLGIILIIILSIYLYFSMGRYVYNKLVYFLPGLLVFPVFLFWILKRKNITINCNLYKWKSANLILGLIFASLFLMDIFIIYFRLNLYERPTVFFIVISLMSGLIFLEIIFSEQYQARPILIQIILIALILSISQLVIYPTVVGVDPFWHQMFATKIMELHYIPDGYSYSQLPLFHLTTAITSILTGLNYKYSTAFSLNLAFIICNSIFIFLIGKMLFKSYKIGLLSSLMLIISNQHIFMSFWTIPNGFASIFIPIILYLLLKTKIENESSLKILLLIFMVAIILSHTIAPFALLLVIISWAIISTIIKPYYLYEYKNYPGNFNLYILTFSIFMIFWWFYASKFLISFLDIIKWGMTIDYFVRAPTEILNYATSIPLAEQSFAQLGMYLFFALSIFGILYMLSEKRSPSCFEYAIGGLMLLSIGFFSSLTSNANIASRWWYFSMLILSIPLAATFFILVSIARSKVFGLSLSFIILISLTFLLIMSPSANIDNTAFSPNSKMRFAPTDSEYQALDTISGIIQGTLETDAYYKMIASNSFGLNSTSIDNDIYNSNFNKSNDQLILIRDEIIYEPFSFFNALYRLDFDPRIILEKTKYSKIYEDGPVNAYLYSSHTYYHTSHRGFDELAPSRSNQISPIIETSLASRKALEALK